MPILPLPSGAGEPSRFASALLLRLGLSERYPGLRCDATVTTAAAIAAAVPSGPKSGTYGMIPEAKPDRLAAVIDLGLAEVGSPEDAAIAEPIRLGSKASLFEHVSGRRWAAAWPLVVAEGMSRIRRI